MEAAAAEKHLENAAAKAAATKVRADSNSDGVSGYRGLNHHGRNHEASYFRDSCYFHVTTLAYRSAEAASSLRKQKRLPRRDYGERQERRSRRLDHDRKAGIASAR